MAQEKRRAGHFHATYGLVVGIAALSSLTELSPRALRSGNNAKGLERQGTLRVGMKTAPLRMPAALSLEPKGRKVEKRLSHQHARSLQQQALRRGFTASWPV